MNSTHKKLIIIGAVTSLVGIIVSSFSPSVFSGLYANVGRNDPLILLPLTFIVTTAQSFLTPFGAALTAFGTAFHLLKKEEPPTNEQ